MAGQDQAAAPVVAFAPGRARSQTVTLEWPVIVDGQEITEITVSRLTGQQLADVAEAKGDNYAVYAAMTGLPVAVILGLDAVDSQAVLEVAQGFLPQSTTTAAGPTGASSTSTLPSSPGS